MCEGRVLWDGVELGVGGGLVWDADHVLMERNRSQTSDV